MSYCRFSSDNFHCDLYCYETSEGYVTHVASSRIIGEPPEIDLEKGAGKALEALRERSVFFANCERVRIGLPYDGERFVDGSLGEMISRVESLVALGYRVPGGLVESLQEEMKGAGIEQ